MDDERSTRTPVSLAKLVDELAVVNDLTELYLNRRTGETFFINDEMISEAEAYADGEPDPLRSLEPEDLEKTNEVLGGGDWIMLPDQFQLEESRAMRTFAANQHPGVRQKLDGVLHRPGAFRNFKRVIDECGVREAWFAFRGEWYADAVRRTLELHDIPFRP